MFDAVYRDSLYRVMATDEMSARLSRIIKPCYASTKTKVRASGVTHFLRDTFSSYIFNNIIDAILAQDSQGCPGVHVGLLAAVERQVVLPDVKPLADVGNFKCFSFIFTANAQSTEEIRSRINFARSTFSRLQSCLCSRREIS